MREHTARTTSCVIQVGNSFLCASLLSKERERDREKECTTVSTRVCVQCRLFAANMCDKLLRTRVQ